MKTIGILGGMGPSASCEFYSRIIQDCQKRGAVQDTDFPPMILYSLPLQGFDETGIVDKKMVLKQLIQGIRTLESAGCDFITIPCNTVHVFMTELRKNSSIPILSIVEETKKKVKHPSIAIGSKTTMGLDIYQMETVNDQDSITQLILEVMSSQVRSETKQRVLTLIRDTGKDVVLACTELPLAITQADLNIKVYDTLQILAEAAVDHMQN
ncbi:MAG: aspartate/glutamate racemase family protein [Nanobdellota archaeon]